MAGTSASELIQLRESTLIPPNIFFVWLNRSSEDFEKFKQQLCKESLTTSRDWKLYGDKDDCSRFIKQAKSKQNIVFVSSGRLGTEIVNDLHDLPQVHSIYIYCNKKDKYESLKIAYRKVRGVFDNPVQLYDQMCHNLDEEARRSQSDISVANDALPIPKNTTVQLHCLFNNEIKSYLKPNVPWCPWRTNSCTVSLPEEGQGTIELWLYESSPFELRISNKEDPNNNDTNSYTIVLKVDAQEAQLGTLDVHQGHELRVRDSTTELHQVLHSYDGYWHCYWLTFYGENRTIQYGVGEIRPKFKILEAHLQEHDKASIQSISYLHIRINNSTDINAMKHLKDDLRIFVGKEPIIFDPPLLIISPNEFSPTRPAKRNGVLATLLENPCQNLYLEAMKFTLKDNSFSNFIETIEHSVSNPDGWCHQKLKEKANQFGRPRAEATYLCITVDELETGKVKYPCVMKIWPPGYYSPVHNHGDTYGIIRVLHGKLLVKYFPALSLNFRQTSPIEQLFEENQVTWLIPKLNQTHQMKNPDMYGSCCITIQCYQYDSVDQVHCERFGFITNDGHHIEYYNCLPDNNYLAFKKAMMMETRRETAV